MVQGRFGDYREVLLLLGRAAGLSGLALATLASGPCGDCNDRDECGTVDEIKTVRDAAVASATSSGGSSGSATTDTFTAANMATASGWDGTSCPTADQYRAISVLRNPARYSGSIVEVISRVGGQCCYHVIDDCPGGRPFLVSGESRVAPVSGGLRPVASQQGVPWLFDAQVEHASVAAFARLSLHLLALGAPSDLVRDAQLASLDELRHADFFFELASRHTGTPSALRPSALDVSGALDDLSLAALIESNLREGCIGETLAAEHLRHRARHVADDETRAALLAIADDETRHAELAFRILRWCRDAAPELTRATLQRVLDDPTPPHRSSAVWQQALSPLFRALSS